MASEEYTLPAPLARAFLVLQKELAQARLEIATLRLMLADVSTNHPVKEADGIVAPDGGNSPPSGE